MWNLKYLIYVLLVQVLLIKVVESVESSNSMDGGDNISLQGSLRDVNSVLLNRDQANRFLNVEDTRLLLTKRQHKGSKYANRRLGLLGKIVCFEKKTCGAGKNWKSDSRCLYRDECTSCTTGRYQNQNSHYSKCKSCATTCGKGTKFSACSKTADRTCPSCGTGQYQNSNSHSSTSCKSCTSGKHQDQNAQAGCKSCSAGKYQNSNSQSACKSCPGGKYQNQNAQSACKSCPGGQYQNSNAQSACKSCPGGQYQNSNAQSSC